MSMMPDASSSRVNGAAAAMPMSPNRDGSCFVTSVNWSVAGS